MINPSNIVGTYPILPSSTTGRDKLRTRLILIADLVDWC